MARRKKKTGKSWGGDATASPSPGQAAGEGADSPRVFDLPDQVEVEVIAEGGHRHGGRHYAKGARLPMSRRAYQFAVERGLVRLVESEGRITGDG